MTTETSHPPPVVTRPVTKPREDKRSLLAARLARLGIVHEADLALHLPLRYEDYTTRVPLAQLHAGMSVCTEGVVTASEVRYRPRRQWVCAIESGEENHVTALTLRFFTFYPNQQKALTIGMRVRVFGEVRDGHFGLEMVHPKFMALGATTSRAVPLPNRLTPVYPTTGGLSQEVLTKQIARVLQRETVLRDDLPEALRRQEGLWDWAKALNFLHAPPPGLSGEEQAALSAHAHPAWQRIKFDELLAQQLSLKRHKAARAGRRAEALSHREVLTDALLQRLPFTLTAAQQRVWKEIGDDLARAAPMHRLLQGDVGSGKTVIAALAALRAVENGRQVALMAPTEILAEQHYHKLSAWLAGLPVRLVWLTGTLTAAQHKKALATLADGEPVLAIGTHALFQKGVTMPNLTLAIVDEQHRFGVAQRLALRDRGAGVEEVHQLMMSATPIPRTLAMSFYADLDVSVIDELPPGRMPVTTRLVNQARRAEIIAHVGKRCKPPPLQGEGWGWGGDGVQEEKGAETNPRPPSAGTPFQKGAKHGAQTYWVCPLIEESEKLSLQAAQTLYEELVVAFDGENKTAEGEPLPKLEVGLLHGRMKPADKAATMEAFVRGGIHILVATTVIEVGVDVANASTMVIEHAERFGLAQLHQLRGRVGRGACESQCILLFETPLGATAKERLKVIFENNDGFEIARQDLRIRGPGELLGARQAGVPLLRFADPERDEALLERASRVADRLLKTEEGEAAAVALIDRWLGDKAEFFKA
ncbi:MAG: ATP-dependent DNA helicase RecG [Burkholderiales bacterium]|jgi:ATP-dependent DNA helicase RecG|nr:ATP-dependent DNA helicase RecG [Burkholderiales bacterium]